MLETTDLAPQKVDPYLTTKIVGSYVKHHTIGAGEVSELITSVHGALSQLGRPNQPEEVLTPAVPVRRSVRHDYVVCLDCGHRGKMLLRHISKQHGLSRHEYLKRWGLRSDHPLTAPGYSEQRSTMAKQLGLGHKTAGEVPAAAAPMARASAAANATKAKPARRRSTPSASKSNVAIEAPAENTRRRSRRTRSHR
jgi:predicted transcriptional regulator